MRFTAAARTIVAGLSLLLPLASARSAPVEAPVTAQALARLDSYIQGVAAAGQFSGVVLVAKDGHVVFERAYGLRDEKRDDPLTINTRFDLASAGKMFAATAILQQIAAGKLRLATTLGEVLPDYPNRAMRPATILQLLTHSAGAGETDALFYPDDLAWRTHEPSVADLVTLYGNREPTFPPGTKQEYSNHTMTLLGRIVEVLSGEDYRSYLAAHVFGPAGMDAGHANEVCRTDDPALAVGYVAVADERMPNCFTALDGGWPAGGQSFTARDMFRFVTALRQGRLAVPHALFEEATTPKRKAFGLGFFATDYGGEFLSRDLRWGHGGQLYGQCVDVRTYEATGETIVTLANNGSPACFRIAAFLHADWRQRNRTKQSP